MRGRIPKRAGIEVSKLLSSLGDAKAPQLRGALEKQLALGAELHAAGAAALGSSELQAQKVLKEFYPTRKHDIVDDELS